MENSKYDLRDLGQKAIKHAEKLKVDYADVRLDDYSTSMIFRENKKYEDISHGNGFGLGIRVIHNGKLGFYSTTDADPIFAVERAIKLAKANPQKNKIKLKQTKPAKAEIIGKGVSSIQSHPVEENAVFVKEVENTAQISPLLKSIRLRLGNGFANHFFANTEGSELFKKMGRTTLYVYITAKEGSQLEQTVFRLGSKNYSVYKDYEDKLKEKAKLAIDLLKAKKPRAGKFNVLLDPGSAGVFAHEAVGHAAEADLVLNEQSILKGKIGKGVASNCVTITDDSTRPGDNWSSYKYDSEGVLGRKTEIIKKGILNSFLQSRETAAEMDTELTGNGRAQGYEFLPIVRMSNTSFEPGNKSFEELLEQLKNGYYLVGFTGGQVGTLEGNFTFASTHCHEVENGKIKNLLKGCTFSGKTLETLKNIMGVQKDLRKYDFGFCGKGGQKVPVSDGCAHVLVHDLFLGGEE